MREHRLPSVAAVACLSLVGSGACLMESSDGQDVQFTRSSLTAGQSFLVSFSGGSIPAGADAVVAAAGGSDAVGAVSAVHSMIGPVQASSASKRRPPAAHPVGGDPLSFRQWDMDQIRAPQAHAISLGKKSVLVGVIDSGVDLTHPDLAGQVDAEASVSCLGG